MTACFRKIAILDMDVQGKLTEREVLPGSELWLDNTIAGRLYPKLQLVLISLPTEVLEQQESIEVQDALFKVTFNGTSYRMVGSGGGAKNGKFYFADAEHAVLLHKRFQSWPEALITYFGIQTSDCKRIAEAEGTVLIVPDNVLGTNDCRGWISESMFANLDAPGGAFYQFRLGFDQVNGKGSFKVMKDDVAQAIGADIIIPESSCKPAPKLPEWSYDKREARIFNGPLVVGLREISKDLVFASSYTVAQHASKEVMLTEIVPKARLQLQELKEAMRTANHEKLVQQIGKKISLDDFANDPGESQELRAVEATLLADGSGEICQHPYIHRQVDKLLARWAYKLMTGGGLHLPGFALADDGYLFLRADGSVQAGSDWIPGEIALTSLESNRSLCVRYPVRMKEDLLPMQNCTSSQAVQLLLEHGLTLAEAEVVASEQLYLRGTYTLHSQTAKKNGGDYDFDQVCVVDEALYPKFVEDRFSFTSTYKVTKTKADRLKSPLYTLEHVALRSMGNQIGVITDTMSSCIAAGNMDAMYKLVVELQKEIDSLKHNTKADLEVIRDIKSEVQKAPWLAFKNATTVSELLAGNRDECTSKDRCTCFGGHALIVEDTDRVGAMYNMLRHDLIDILNKPMEIRQFEGLLVGNTPSKEMLDECRTLYHAISTGHAMLRGVFEQAQQQVSSAVLAFEQAKESGDDEAKRVARKYLAKVRGQLRMWEDKHKERSSNLLGIVSAWGRGKTENRKQWAQALHTIVSRGKGTGSMLFHAFPQEAVDSIALRTGGIRTVVAPNKVLGTVSIINNCFFMQPANSAAYALFQYDATQRRLLKPSKAS